MPFLQGLLLASPRPTQKGTFSQDFIFRFCFSGQPVWRYKNMAKLIHLSSNQLSLIMAYNKSVTSIITQHISLYSYLSFLSSLFLILSALGVDLPNKASLLNPYISLYRELRQIPCLLIFQIFSFLIKVFVVVNFPLSTTLAASYKFRYFLVLLCFSSQQKLFSPTTGSRLRLIRFLLTSFLLEAYPSETWVSGFLQGSQCIFHSVLYRLMASSSALV